MGSGTDSRQKRRYSLRFKLFLAILGVALVCILASAVLAHTLSYRQIKDYINKLESEESEGHPQADDKGGMTRKGEPRFIGLAFLLAGLLGVLLAFILSYYLADRISKPLSELTAATRGIAAGDYGERVDVSGGKEVEELGEAFNTLSESLEHNETLRKNMVADVAHELRNPLATLRAQLEALEDGVIDLDRGAIDSLMEDTVLLSRLVEDLQQLSLVESGQLELDMMPVDVGETIRGAASRFEHEFSQREISLELDIAPGLPMIKADQLRIAQVLGNLLKNSLLHTPEGGFITMGAIRSEGEVVFSVADTGSGVEKDELPDIFERFYRTDRSRSRATGKAGLGLSIAKSLVEAHGGRIWAESEIGEGTTVFFTVPVCSGESG